MRPSIEYCSNHGRFDPRRVATTQFSTRKYCLRCALSLQVEADKNREALRRILAQPEIFDARQVAR